MEDSITKDKLDQVLSECVEKYPGLSSSSKEKELTLYFGNAGSGKTTLINCLAGRDLEAAPSNTIVSSNPRNSILITTAEDLNTELPCPRLKKTKKYIHYEIPELISPIGETGCLVNACYLKHLIEASACVRIVFVARYEEVTVMKGFLLKNLVNRVKLLFGESVKDYSCLVITKSPAGKSLYEVINYIMGFTDLRKGFHLDKIEKMSVFDGDTAGLEDRTRILEMLERTNAKMIQTLSNESLFSIEDTSIIKGIISDRFLQICNRLFEKLRENSGSLDKDTVSGIVNSKFLLKINRSEVLSLLNSSFSDLFGELLVEFCQSYLENDIKNLIAYLENYVHPGTYYIINTYYGESLFCSNDKMKTDNIIEARKNQEERSKFLVKKEPKGYLLFNIEHKKHVFLAKGDKIGEDRIAEAREDVMERSYFDIVKNGEGFTIKSIELKEYLYLSKNLKSGDKVLQGTAKVGTSSIFKFIRCS